MDVVVLVVETEVVVLAVETEVVDEDVVELAVDEDKSVERTGVDDVVEWNWEGGDVVDKMVIGCWVEEVVATEVGWTAVTVV